MLIIHRVLLLSILMRTPWDYKINDAVGSGSFSIAPYATEFGLPITINSSEALMKIMRR